MSKKNAPAGGTVDPVLEAAHRQHAGGDSKGALQTLNQARARRGDDPALLFAIANILRDLGQHQGALEIYRMVEAALPGNAALLNNMANTLCALKDFTGAQAKAAAACAHEPGNPELYLTAANIACAAGDLDGAAAGLRRVLELDPAHGGAMLNMAEILADRGDIPASLEWQQRARARLGDHPRLLFNMSQSLFRLGRLAEAWPMYETRFQSAPGGKPRSVPRICRQPRWDGAAQGKLLVWMEQGVGEEILYASLLPDAMARCADIVVECDKRLVPLFARSLPGIAFVARSQPPDPLAETAALQIPAASLGQHFRAGYADFPAHKGFLRADAAKAAAMREIYRALGKGPVIGVSWRSKPRTYEDPKSIPLGLWGPVFAHQDAVFVNLQYGDCAEDIAFCQQQGWRLHHDPSVDPLQNLDVFAAQVAACDHVITVSNTTAHVAGALNVTADVLVSAGKDAPHHWFERRENSPWYPSLKLRWQNSPGRWGDLLDGIARTLPARR
ncbi:MAG: tetratricopeptide repeat protein [Alphaproteobacteria bacterium]|nr:tetratricopeptide repeat protein [Alphaproteobacteria bacterium]